MAYIRRSQRLPASKRVCRVVLPPGTDHFGITFNRYDIHGSSMSSHKPLATIHAVTKEKEVFLSDHWSLAFESCFI